MKRVASKSTAAEKKAEKKRKREEAIAEAARLDKARETARKESPMWPLLDFCEKLGDFPWNNASNNWGFNEDSTERAMLSVPVPPPNDTLLKISGLHVVLWDGTCEPASPPPDREEASLVELTKGYTYGDIAQAVEDAAIEQGAG